MMSETISIQEYTDGYNFLYNSLSKSEKKEYTVQITKVRGIMNSSVRNFISLLDLKSMYEYHYSESKRSNNINYQCLTVIVFFGLIYFNQEVGDRVFISLGFVSLFFLYFMKIYFRQSQISNEITMREIQHEKYKTELYSNGVPNSLVDDLINLNENVINSKYLSHYNDFDQDTYNKKMNENEKRYRKLHYILDLEIMNFITQSETFMKNKELFENLTMTDYFTELSD